MVVIVNFSQVLHHRTSISYPPSAAYQISFLKYVISQVSVCVCAYACIVAQKYSWVSRWKFVAVRWRRSFTYC